MWEVTVDARRNSDAVSAPFTLTASILGATVSPNPDVIASASDRRAGGPVVHDDEPVRCVHRTGGRHGARERVSGPRRRSPTAQQQVIDVTVAPARRRCGRRSGARPTRRPTSTCSSSTARPAPACWPGQSADGDSEESVTINNPGSRVCGVVARRRLRGAGRHDDVQLRRRVRQPGVRLGERDRRERAASGRLELDGPGIGHGECRCRRPDACCSATSRCGRTRTCWSARAT